MSSLDIVIWNYIEEFFYRLIYIITSFIITFIILFIYFEEIYELLMNPIIKLNYEDLQGFIYTDVTELLYTNIYVAFLFSFIIHFPFFLFTCGYFLILL